MSGCVAVIGAGIMGAGIAQSLAVGGCRVRLFDISAAALDAGMRRIEHGRFGIARAVGRGKLGADEGQAALARLEAVRDEAAACDGVDAVVEAVPEDLALKCSVFRRLDALAPAHAVLASNTAGLPITALAWATQRPERVVGWHWAQPAPLMRLAEIIVHDRTAPEIVEAVSALARRCGKNPVVIRDQPETWGFVANRINRAVRREAARVVEEGIATEDQVDTIMRDCFRWPMGPFEMQRPGSME
jgi:3-hydroxybutyryl-CoA dehydrogenase